MACVKHTWFAAAVLLAALVGCSGEHRPVGENEAKTTGLASSTETAAPAVKEATVPASPEAAASETPAPETATSDAAKEATTSASDDVAPAAGHAGNATEAGSAPSATLPRGLTLGGVEPAPDDLLLLAYGDDPDTLNPITGSDTVSEAFQRQVYETLATPSYSNPDNLEPTLAESWEFDEPSLTFTIHLRKGVMWQPIRLPSGRELPPREFTARDVKFTFDCVLNPYVEAAHLRSYFEDPEATEAANHYKIKVSIVDDYTVKVRWTKPYFLAAEFTLNGVQIIPRHVFSVDANGDPISFDFTSREFADGFNKHWANTLMCGTGPMQLHRWVRGTGLELLRNEHYWGNPYYFSRLTMRCINNPNTMTQQLLQSQLDFGGIAEKDKFLQSKENPNVVNGRVKLVSYDYPAYRYLGYNLNRPFFHDREVRWALSHAVPVQRICDEIFKGLAIPVAGPFLPGSSSADPSIKPVPFDLAEARRLLDEAGWRDDDHDGIREKMIDNVKTLARFDLIIFSDSPSFQAVAEVIKENCRQIGVDVTVSPTKWALMLQKLNKKDFDAAMLGWAMSWKDDPFQLWHSSQADVPDSSNFVGYRNAEVDRLINQLRVTMDPAAQQTLYHQIHQQIYHDQPYTFLFSEKATGAYDARLENVKFYKIRPCVDSREWYASRPRLTAK